MRKVRESANNLSQQESRAFARYTSGNMRPLHDLSSNDEGAGQNGLKTSRGGGAAFIRSVCLRRLRPRVLVVVKASHNGVVTQHTMKLHGRSRRARCHMSPFHRRKALAWPFLTPPSLAADAHQIPWRFDGLLRHACAMCHQSSGLQIIRTV